MLMKCCVVNIASAVSCAISAVLFSRSLASSMPSARNIFTASFFCFLFNSFFCVGFSFFAFFVFCVEGFVGLTAVFRGDVFLSLVFLTTTAPVPVAGVCCFEAL